MLTRKTELKRTAFKPAEPKPAAGPRQKSCKVCREKFVPARALQAVCGMTCAQVLAAKVTAAQKAKQQRQERAQDKVALLALKPLAYFLKKAEKACNAYIRARDAGQGCISCGRHDADVWNAGHFVSVGANSYLRFDEDNIHLQCARPCNMDKGGNLIEYRKALLLKIGSERLARLEGWHEPVKRTRADVEAIEAYYKAKLKKLKIPC